MATFNAMLYMTKPLRGKGVKKCPRHIPMEVVFTCHDCEGELICTKCAKSLHKSHSFDHMTKQVSDKRENIQSYAHNLESQAMPQVQQQMDSIDVQLKENTEHFESVIAAVKLRSKEFRSEIIKVTRKFIITCKKLEKENVELLNKYKSELYTNYLKLNSKLQECKRSLQSENSALVFDLEKELQRKKVEIVQPTPPELSSAAFQPRLFSLDKIEKLVGSLTLVDMAGVMEAKVLVAEPEMVPQYQVYDKSMEARFEHCTNITSLAIASFNKAWVSHDTSCDVLGIDIHGKVKQTIEQNLMVDDISLAPITGNLWMCCESDLSIREIIKSKTPSYVGRVRFHTTDRPWCLCVTHDNSVAVGTKGEVTLYTPDGILLRKSGYDSEGRNVVVEPNHIKTCPLTGDLAICDLDDITCGGNDNPFVMVLDKRLKPRFRYERGTPPAEDNQVLTSTATFVTSTAKLQSAFMPLDACYDYRGHLLVADYDNRSILLVSGSTGQFLTKLHLDDLRPGALALQADGKLWIGFPEEKVIKVLKYKLAVNNQISPTLSKVSGSTY